MITFPKKKGRKSKKELEQLALNKKKQELMNDDTMSIEEKNNQILGLDQNALLVDDIEIKKVPKKRGRKPKGGKIIKVENSENQEVITKPNIILHLKCNKLDIDKIFDNDFESFKFQDLKVELKYENIIDNTLNNNNPHNNTLNNNNPHNNNLNNNNPHNNIFEKNCINDINYIENNNLCYLSSDILDKNLENKNINKKLDNLIRNFHTNNISDKKTACFWCTYDFSNPPIYIPKNFINQSYNVYGCFCSPECACAYLMNENIDTSIRFERFYLLNSIYCKIYDYKKNIKPAPSPFYLLDKYMGTLTIQEYRKVLQNERLLIVIDKPLTPVLPELFFENDDFTLNSKFIPASL